MKGKKERGFPLSSFAPFPAMQEEKTRQFSRSSLTLRARCGVILLPPTLVLSSSLCNEETIFKNDKNQSSAFSWYETQSRAISMIWEQNSWIRKTNGVPILINHSHARETFPLPLLLLFLPRKKRRKTREKGELGAYRRATENFVERNRYYEERGRRIAHIALFSRSPKRRCVRSRNALHGSWLGFCHTSGFEMGFKLVVNHRVASLMTAISSSES